MTAVASPPSLQPLPRLGWASSGNGQSGLDSMSQAEVSRIFTRKTPQRQDSSGSISSTSSAGSTTSTSTINSRDPKARSGRNSGDWAPVAGSTGWSSQQGSETAVSLDVSSARTNVAPQQPPTNPLPQAPMAGLHQGQPVVPSQKVMQAQQQVNGARMAPPAPNTSEPPALLVLLPMNGTFERKQINVPLFPEILRIGRQTNAKTVPTPSNGYFDSKVLSRQHAEVWADRNGKIWIRDVKSSNGTFVNGARLSLESRESDPHELRENDMLELGIDIVSEDQKSIVHHKVSAKVEHAGPHTNAANVMDLNIGDIDPGSGAGVMGPLYPQMPMRGRGGSQGSVMSNGRIGGQVANVNGMGVPRHMNGWLAPVSIEQVVKRLGNELKSAKQQASDLHRTHEFFNAVLTSEPGKVPPKAPASILPQPPQPNGIGSPRRADPISPFSGPPAPPPQQPLPEKPDAARSLPGDVSKALSPLVNASPTKNDNSSSQIMSLAEALANTKKELESQGNRVKFLEESLKQERRARETAEERARHLMERNRLAEAEKIEKLTGIPQSIASSVVSTHASASDTEIASDAESVASENTLGPDDSVSESGDTARKEAQESALFLQERLNMVLREMDEMRIQMEIYKQRAEVSEKERSNLADMVERIRNKHKEMKATQDQDSQKSETKTESTGLGIFANGYADGNHQEDDTSHAHTSRSNGSISSSAKQMQQFQTAVAQAFVPSRDDRLAQSAPYASILGVVLLGVGIMTYLNGWNPKTDQ